MSTFSKTAKEVASSDSQDRLSAPLLENASQQFAINNEDQKQISEYSPEKKKNKSVQFDLGRNSELEDGETPPVTPTKTTVKGILSPRSRLYVAEKEKKQTIDDSQIVELIGTNGELLANALKKNIDNWAFLGEISTSHCVVMSGKPNESDIRTLSGNTYILTNTAFYYVDMAKQCTLITDEKTKLKKITAVIDPDTSDLSKVGFKVLEDLNIGNLEQIEKITKHQIPIAIPIVYQELGSNADNATSSTEIIQAWLKQYPPYLQQDSGICFKPTPETKIRVRRTKPVIIVTRQTKHIIGSGLLHTIYRRASGSDVHNNKQKQAVCDDGITKLEIFQAKFLRNWFKSSTVHKEISARHQRLAQNFADILTYAKTSKIPTAPTGEIPFLDRIYEFCDFLKNDQLRTECGLDLSSEDALKISLLVQLVIEYRFLLGGQAYHLKGEKFTERQTEHLAVIESILGELVGCKLGKSAISESRIHHNKLKAIQAASFNQYNRLVIWGGDRSLELAPEDTKNITRKKKENKSDQDNSVYLQLASNTADAKRKVPSTSDLPVRSVDDNQQVRGPAIQISLLTRIVDSIVQFVLAAAATISRWWSALRNACTNHDAPTQARSRQEVGSTLKDAAIELERIQLPSSEYGLVQEIASDSSDSDKEISESITTENIQPSPPPSPSSLSSYHPSVRFDYGGNSLTQSLLTTPETTGPTINIQSS